MTKKPNEMKTIIRFMALCILLCAVQCPQQDLYYMPFKESGNGMNTASFYLDGEPFRSERQAGYHASGDSLGTRFSLTCRCSSDLHSETWADLRISMVPDPGETLSTKKDYRITPYVMPDPAAGIEGTPAETSYARISIGNNYAKSGWIRFRSHKGKYASGNFEFVFEDDDFVEHTVLYGNFDAFMGN